jgi:hypothetical protein
MESTASGRNNTTYQRTARGFWGVLAAWVWLSSSASLLVVAESSGVCHLGREHARAALKGWSAFQQRQRSSARSEE